MKRRWVLLAGVAVLGVALLTGACSKAKAERADGASAGAGAAGIRAAEGVSIIPVPQQTGISVSGQGKVTVTPDLALLRLGVEAKAPTVSQARDDAAGAMDAILQALKANGVAEKDIKTQVLSIYPYEERKLPQPNGGLTEKGFRVNNIVSAKIRDVQKAGAIVDAVVNAGGDLTRLDGINFTVEDPSKVMGEAREKAVAEAKAKGEQLAKLMGVKLGKPISINDSGGGPIMEGFAPMAKLGMGGDAATSVSPGEMEIAVFVNVTYSIE